MSVLLAALLIAADAPTPAERIASGIAAFDALEYEAAAVELSLAADDARATEDERVRAQLYAGMCNRVLGRDTDARLNFIYVLKRAPHTELPPDVPPKIRSFFALVREELGISSTATASPGAGATPAPVDAPPPPPATRSPDASPAPGDAAAPTTAAFATAGVGGAVAVAGVIAAIVGGESWLAHESAVAGLEGAAATGGDGAALQLRQREARVRWESWGALLTSVGVGAVVAGVAAAAAGVVVGVGLGDDAAEQGAPAPTLAHTGRP